MHSSRISLVFVVKRDNNYIPILIPYFTSSIIKQDDRTIFFYSDDT